MKIHYFQSAWEDIRHTPNWFGKLLLLALIAFIPVVGAVIILAYLYGWAREIAWGSHEPAPKRIFSNPDGKFWTRGWLVLVVLVAYMAIPFILNLIASSIDPYVTEWTIFGPQAYSDPLLGTLRGALTAVAALFGIFLLALAWVGSMRVAIYNRLSAGFQLGKVWAMLRHDAGGIVRIYLMYLLFSVVFACLMAIIGVVFVGVVASIGFSMLGGAPAYGASYGDLWVMRAILASGGVGILLGLAYLYLMSVCMVFAQTLAIRALGYWTMQFNVPLWGGQDDPLPFELQERPAPGREAAPEAPVIPAADPVVTDPAAAAAQADYVAVTVALDAEAAQPAPAPDDAPPAAPPAEGPASGSDAPRQS